MKPLIKEKFDPSCHIYMHPKYRLATVCDENCDIHSGNRHTDRKVKTEGHKIMYMYTLYIDIRYLHTVVIDGPKTYMGQST